MLTPKDILLSDSSKYFIYLLFINRTKEISINIKWTVIYMAIFVPLYLFF